MLVFRTQQRQVRSADLRAAIDRALARVEARTTPDSADVLELLLLTGELEAAVSDTRFVERDDADAISESLAAAAQGAGALLWLGTHPGGDPGPVLAAIRAQRDTVDALGLPALVDHHPAERFASDGVSPEAYQEAAVEYATAHPGRRFTCLGLRTIGSTLAAAVAGALQAVGRDALTLTLRPRGPPLARTIRWTPRLAAEVASRGDGVVLILDAGPGSSAASLVVTATAVEALAIPPERIVLFTDWSPDPRRAPSEDLPPGWQRFGQLAARFERTWLESGRLARAAGVSSLVDVGAGGWRPWLLPRSRPWPAVQPLHERRKYLAPEAGTLLKFVGLGQAGERARERSEQVAAAGFGPAPTGLAHGFLAQPFLSGAPLEPGTREPGLIERLAGYLAYLCREQACEPRTVTDLAPMIELNTSTVVRKANLGALLQRLAPGFPPLERPTRLDARMFPHEWLRTSEGLLKTDSADHFDDHFYPGPHDIAWDVAGTCLEFRLQGQERQQLVGAYRRLSGDSGIAGRLPWFALAYLAFRVGYARLAAETLRIGEDAERFRRSILRYTALIGMELADTRGAAWRG